MYVPGPVVVDFIDVATAQRGPIFLFTTLNTAFALFFNSPPVLWLILNIFTLGGYLGVAYITYATQRV